MALSFRQLYQLARSVGLDDRAARMAAAIGLAESGGRPGAVGDRGQSIGIWQIHTPSHPWASREQLKDPLYNARAMARISRGGRDWRPWTVFRSGAYRKFMGEDPKPMLLPFEPRRPNVLRLPTARLAPDATFDIWLRAMRGRREQTS